MPRGVREHQWHEETMKKGRRGRWTTKRDDDRASRFSTIFGWRERRWIEWIESIRDLRCTMPTRASRVSHRSRCLRQHPKDRPLLKREIPLITPFSFSWPSKKKKKNTIERARTTRTTQRHKTIIKKIAAATTILYPPCCQTTGPCSVLPLLSYSHHCVANNNKLLHSIIIFHPFLHDSLWQQ